MFSDATPTLEMLPSEQWRVAVGFAYTLGRTLRGLPGGTVIDVPAGVNTDLASIPRLLWSILPPNGNYAPAAIVHDRLYRDHRVGAVMVTRIQADAVLLAAMAELGDVAWLTRWVIYLAVRIGAWWAWK